MHKVSIGLETIRATTIKIYRLIKFLLNRKEMISLTGITSQVATVIVIRLMAKEIHLEMGLTVEKVIIYS